MTPTPTISNIGRSYSGVVLNQNGAPEAPSDYLVPSTPVHQAFRLPPDYARGGSRVPDVTGVQVRVGVISAAAALTVRLEHKSFFGSWTTLVEGQTATVAVVDDEVWLTYMFDTPVEVEGMQDDEFRIRLSDPLDVARLWYTVPNPLASVGGSKAYALDGTTALLDSGREYSLCFRVLGAVADAGTDFLGNQYRSAVIRRSAANGEPTSAQDVAWLSGPQPSKFAVVSQYYDVGNLGEPVVIDSVVLDPVTPGMWVHVYYATDGEPGATDEEWEERIWTPVPRPFHALRRDTYAFPEPIRARYIKLEYSHLQARSYSPGAFQKPIEYKKHPKWVLDYFLLVTEDARNASEDRFIARNVSVSYDAYSLAFTYFQDDLRTQVNPPPFLTPEDRAAVEQFVSARDDLSDVVDGATRAQINTIMQPYLYDPRTRSVARSLLGDTLVLDTTGSGYPLEVLPGSAPVGAAVSQLDRDAVVFEQSFPVMHFYLPCRHRYRHVAAELSHDRAYFAGVREVAFTRERYHVEYDAPMYTETLGDHLNSERNDFL